MPKKALVPNAWEDDWESQADKVEAEAEEEAAQESTKITKAERLAKHAETNKKLWESAETPETFHFLAARDTVPLKQEFKPALKVLSRKPTPKTTQRIDPITGLASLSIEYDDEDEGPKKDQPTAEELRSKTQREREEKQKRYDEARARILGTGSGTSSPVIASQNNDSRSGSRNKGRGGKDIRNENRRPDSQSGSRQATRELFDPNFTPKTGVMIQKRNGDSPHLGRSTPKPENRIIREPRGPDNSGRGGFGFANRGRN